MRPVKALQLEEVASFDLSHLRKLENDSVLWRGVVVDVLYNKSNTVFDLNWLASACMHLELSGEKPDHSKVTLLRKKIELALAMPTPKFIILWSIGLSAPIPCRVIPIQSSDLDYFSETSNDLYRDFQETNGVNPLGDPFCRFTPIGTVEGLHRAVNYILDSDIRWFSHLVSSGDQPELLKRKKYIQNFVLKQVALNESRFCPLPTFEESSKYCFEGDICKPPHANSLLLACKT